MARGEGASRGAGPAIDPRTVLDELEAGRLRAAGNSPATESPASARRPPWPRTRPPPPRSLPQPPYPATAAPAHRRDPSCAPDPWPTANRPPLSEQNCASAPVPAVACNSAAPHRESWVCGGHLWAPVPGPAVWPRPYAASSGAGTGHAPAPPPPCASGCARRSTVAAGSARAIRSPRSAPPGRVGARSTRRAPSVTCAGTRPAARRGGRSNTSRRRR